MLVSVIIPVFNCRGYLDNCLASLRGQSCDSFEAILVDDCSVDGSREWVSKSPSLDPRFRPLLLEQNGGPAKARNAGIRVATGDYVAFLDADDYWAPGKLAAQVAVLQSSDAVGLCATNGTNVDAGGQPLSPLFDSAKIRNGVISEEEFLLEGLPIVTSSVMVRKSLLDKVGGFKEEYRVAEDFELWFRILRQSELRIIDENLTYYRLHDASITRNKLRNRLSKVAILENEVIKNPEIKAKLGPRFWLDMQRKYCSLGKMLMQDGQKPLGREYLDKAIALNCSRAISMKSRLYKSFL